MTLVRASTDSPARRWWRWPVHDAAARAFIPLT
jgi:hypothetical protein